MRLVKDGQVINLENENHVEAFVQSGWKIDETAAETKAAADAPIVEAVEAPKAKPSRRKA